MNVFIMIPAFGSDHFVQRLPTIERSSPSAFQ